MYRILSTSKTGMNAAQQKLDTISNNLANSNTTAYKSVNVGFSDLLSETLKRVGYSTNSETRMGTGVKASEWFRNFTQGSLTATEQSTDFALDGAGFFKVIMPNGTEAYTRDGSFNIDRNGTLVDGFGNKVELNYVNGFNEESGKLYSSTINVDRNGNVYSKINGNFVKVAEVNVYTAVGDTAFTSIGENLYVPTDGAQIEKATDTHIYQGYLEASNVDMATEFTDMIVASRAYSLTSKGITTADEMWQMINNMRR